MIKTAEDSEASEKTQYYSHNLLYFISLLNKIKNHGHFRSGSESLLSHHFSTANPKWTRTLGKQQ